MPRQIQTSKVVEPDDEEASIEDISLALIKALPRLFVKHQTDANRISTVLVIPQLLNLGMYLEMRMIPTYETLWDDISKQLTTHPSPIVTRRAIGALKHMLATGSLQNVNNKKISELEEDLAKDLRKATKMKSKNSLETTALSEDDVELVELTIFRISSLFSARDLVGWMEDNDGGKQTRILDIFIGLAERAKLGNGIENQVLLFFFQRN
jgi:cohesin complex subunit SA-1/2